MIGSSSPELAIDSIAERCRMFDVFFWRFCELALMMHLKVASAQFSISNHGSRVESLSGSCDSVQPNLSHIRSDSW